MVNAARRLQARRLQPSKPEMRRVRGGKQETRDGFLPTVIEAQTRDQQEGSTSVGDPWLLPSVQELWQQPFEEERGLHPQALVQWPSHFTSAVNKSHYGQLHKMQSQSQHDGPVLCAIAEAHENA